MAQHKFAGKTVAQILETKLARIKNTPLEEGSPGWNAILHLTWEEVVEREHRHELGFRTFKKLLERGRFDK